MVVPLAAMAPQRRIQRLVPADLEELRRICGQITNLKDFPHADTISNNIPVFQAKSLASLVDKQEIEEVQDEWYNCLTSGPGVMIIRGLVPVESVERSMAARSAILKNAGKPTEGTGRVLQFSEKQAVTDPDGFVEYFSNPLMVKLFESYFGPGYYINTQTNSLGPGDKSQGIHRDYHLSHWAPHEIEGFPLAMHIASSLLTFQCAVAHTDMTFEAGPTKVLPYSQQFAKGFLVGSKESDKELVSQFNDYIREHSVQNELLRGDALIFAPAIFHATGENHTEKERVAHLCQVSSGLSNSFEVVDRTRIAKAIWPTLKRQAINAKVYGTDKSASGKLILDLPPVLAAAIDLTMDNFGFPINLERTVHNHGKATDTQGGLMRVALLEGWEDEAAYAGLDKYAHNRATEIA